jgi:hypothetical protein
MNSTDIDKELRRFANESLTGPTCKLLAFAAGQNVNHFFWQGSSLIARMSVSPFFFVLYGVTIGRYLPHTD